MLRKASCSSVPQGRTVGATGACSAEGEADLLWWAEGSPLGGQARSDSENTHTTVLQLPWTAVTQPQAPFRVGWGLLRHLGELLRLHYLLFNAQRFFFPPRNLAQYILINLGYEVSKLRFLGTKALLSSLYVLLVYYCFY